MTKEELTKLLERYHQGICTEAEKLLVESLHLYSHPIGDKIDANDQVKNDIWQDIEATLQSQQQKRLWPWWYSIAAAVLLVIGLGIWYHHGFTPTHPTSQQFADIAAGGNRATLTLNNGRKIELDSTHTGIVIHASTVRYTNNGTAIAHSPDAASAVNYHELATPKGGQYQVILPDSTQVWLNAASTLRFPNEFTADAREVEVSGEAYFEIAPDKNRPFRVKTKAQTIQVLGTAFNVHAYSDEPQERTTLVNGKIKIESNAFSSIIQPGHCATITEQGGAIQAVDTDDEVAWKSGYISFNEQTLENIMRQISRWYDVHITYQGVDPSLRFGGRVSRYAHVSEVLRRLELTEQVRFKIEERRIIVTKY